MEKTTKINGKKSKVIAAFKPKPVMNFTAVITPIEDGWYMGQCEQIPAALTQGRTIEEVKENLKDAINLVLEDDKENFRKAHKGESFIRRKIVMA
jgi:predicted RNase H-like HicB family nuclease